MVASDGVGSIDKYDFSSRLAKARQSKGLTQADVAERVGVTQPTLAAWELPQRREDPRRGEILQLAKALDVNAGWLLTGEGNPNLTKAQAGVRGEVEHSRKHEFDLLSTVRSLLRRYADQPELLTTGLGWCVREYWGSTDLGGCLSLDVARILENVAENYGLNLVEILLASNHCNAAQYTADYLLHAGVDPNGFHPVYDQLNRSWYRLEYSHPRSKELLLDEARRTYLADRDKKNDENNNEKTLIDMLWDWLGIRRRR